MEGGFNTPILLMVFNRPDTTKRVFDVIKSVRPKQLFIASDGPRAGKDGEAEIVSAVRKFIDENIDWDCEIKKLYRDKNLGCKMGVSSAIDWFFQNVEQGIILEDDCLPDPSFFNFCEVLLKKYRDDERIMHIGGASYQNGKVRGEASYYFSKYSHIWGWASWRRAWAHYDVGMQSYPAWLAGGGLAKILPDKQSRSHYQDKFDRVFSGKLDTWDYQWTYAIWHTGGISIIPNYNLVSNIGFGENATHTKTKNIVANQPAQSIINIIHPKEVAINEEADRYYEKSLKFINRVVNKFKAYLLSC